MYDGHMVVQMIKMIEKGNMKLGEGTGVKALASSVSRRSKRQ
jgi:hypothetical protein